MLNTGILTLIVGAVVVLGTKLRGERAERDNDEREELILTRAMRFTFMATALAIQVAWAFENARAVAPVTAIDVVYFFFWFSFIGAYGFNRLRA